MKKLRIILMIGLVFILAGCGAKQEKKTVNAVDFTALSQSDQAKIKFELKAKAKIPTNPKDAKKDVEAVFDLTITNNGNKKVKFDMAKFKLNNSSNKSTSTNIELIAADSDNLFAGLFENVFWQKSNSLTYDGKKINVTSELENKKELNDWMEENSGKVY